MPAAILEKPGLVTAILGGSKLGKGGTDFFIKLLTADMQTGSPNYDVTGDCDPTPKYENNGLLYEKWNLRGAMIAAQAIGLANIVDTTKNPVVDVTFDLGPNRRLKKTILIEWIRIQWSRKAPFVGIAMVADMTETLPANLEIVVP